MMGKIASVLVEDEDAEARPFSKCESGTLTGLCRRINRFFCDLPIPRVESKENLSKQMIEI